ncbi:dimeric alpha-beta barrel domain-containing protein [Stemphylium lycopersici]|uniref:Dimeric alpha-beta barrel domain-containing protein n=1 Tax=Stemphylium lycopersici TaxID=183478 RepID=A0A364MXK9_STELY|nr:dimeric alpha-beta barrel domain-containing protein [Stemphylium lycopersici]
MQITELALLHLSCDVTVDNVALRSKLSHAKTVMQKYTGHAFYYMQQIEEPALVYIVGEWDSLDQHMDKFIPSADNQALLESLKGALTVERLEHIDVPHADLPLPKREAQLEHARQGGLIWSIVRYYIKDGAKQDFLDTLEANKHYIQGFVTEGTIGGGWRIDKEDGKEVFVLLSPWKSVEQHLEFGKTDGFQKYAQIRKYIDGADIKHAKLLDI